MLMPNTASLRFNNVSRMVKRSIKRFDQSAQAKFELAEEKFMVATAWFERLIQQSNLIQKEKDQSISRRDEFIAANESRLNLSPVEAEKRYNNLLLMKFASIICETLISYTTISSLLSLTVNISLAPVVLIIISAGVAYLLVQGSLSAKSSISLLDQEEMHPVRLFLNRYVLSNVLLFFIPIVGFSLPDMIQEIDFGYLLVGLSVVTLVFNLYLTQYHNAFLQFEIANNYNRKLVPFNREIKRIDLGMTKIGRDMISVKESMKFSAFELSSIYEGEKGGIRISLDEENIRLVNSVMGRDVLPIIPRSITIPSKHHSRLSMQWFQVRNSINQDVVEAVNPAPADLNQEFTDSGIHPNSTAQHNEQSHKDFDGYSDSVDDNEKSI